MISLDKGKTKLIKNIDLKKVIEEDVLFGFFNKNESSAENDFCYFIVNRVSEIVKQKSTIRASAEFIGVSYSILKKFLILASELKIINYKKIQSFKKSIQQTELNDLNDMKKKSVVSCFLQSESLQEVVIETNLSYAIVKNVLCENFKCRDVVELRKLIKNNRKKFRKIEKSIKLEKLNLIKKCKILYDDYHTLEKVALELSISREYVRRLLQKGDAIGFFHYQRYGEKRFNDLKTIYDRELLLQKIRESTSEPELCEELMISSRDLNKLLVYFHIDLKAYKKEDQKKECLRLYSGIVSDLGRHPTTYDYLHIKDGPNLIAKIRRYWGSIDKFRNEFGIDAPIRSMPQKSRDGLMRRIKYLQDIKILKRQNVLNLIRGSGLISCKKISECLGLKKNLVFIYLQELQKEGLIQKNGSGNKVQYSEKIK